MNSDTTNEPPPRRIIVPLGNFLANECILGERELHLLPTPAHVQSVIDQARERLFVRDPSEFPMCLVITLPDTIQEESAARDLLEEIILLFRLYKPGNIYYNFILHDNTGWFDNPASIGFPTIRSTAIFFFMGWSHPGIEQTYYVSDQESGHPLVFCAVHRGKSILKGRAFSSFFRGYHEPYTEDRFLRNAIGLENVFVNDSNEQSNIRYKFIDRGCFLLQQADPLGDGVDAYAEALGNIYSARCRLVHSNKANFDWSSEKDIQLLVDADHFLRTTLRYLLTHPELAQVGAIDKLKRKMYG